MGIGRYNKLIAIIDDISAQTEAKDIRVKDMIMTDLSMSKVFFVDKSKHEKMLLSFTIKDINSDNISQISVTYRHIMMKVQEGVLRSIEVLANSSISDEIALSSRKYNSSISSEIALSSISKEHNADLSQTPTSDQENQIPELLPYSLVEAKDLRVGDLIPRWAGGAGIIVERETVVGRSVQIMTENGIIMLDKNILTCHVAPYSFCYYASQPVQFLSGISHYLVKKPFYALPKRLYKRFLLH